MTHYYKFDEQPECKFDNETLHLLDGVSCDNRVQIRRIAFVGSPADKFYGQGLKVLRYDDSEVKDLIANQTTNNTVPYIKTKSNWGTVNFKDKQDPRFSNTGSFVTGHKYRIHWG